MTIDDRTHPATVALLLEDRATTYRLWAERLHLAVRHGVTVDLGELARELGGHADRLEARAHKARQATTDIPTPPPPPMPDQLNQERLR